MMTSACVTGFSAGSVDGELELSLAWHVFVAMFGLKMDIAVEKPRIWSENKPSFVIVGICSNRIS
jgi:hypothetical protein